MRVLRFGRSLLALAILSGFAACNDEETGPGGSLDLTFQLDDTFQGAHGGQDIYVAVVRASDGVVVARESGVVSMTADPAYSVTIANAFEEGVDYQVHYWIDSNFANGDEGVCDPTNQDHQWSVDVDAPTQDVTITESHAPADVVAVCASFTANLIFAGDATYQGPHGDQDITVAVVRASDDLVVAQDDGTVSATATPSFSFEFPGALVKGVAYEIHYWIDSNFGGGTPGQCDPPSNDHQWSVAIATVADNVAITESHDPGNVTDVCDTFGN